MTQHTGSLYVVATPIGNLEDMTARAARVLAEVDLIAAEDTRHSAKLLQHFGITTRLLAVHEHSERKLLAQLLEHLNRGKSLALISDAGTPLVSDPGYRLVQAAHREGIRIVPVPGACAAIAALSAAGLPSDRFAFEGFPPARTGARRAFFEGLCTEPRTLVFYETPHRILESLADMAVVFGSEREAVLARELTKQFETIRAATLSEHCARLERDDNERRGEFVIVLHGAPPGEAGAAGAVDAAAERVLRILLDELPVKQAAALAARITGVKKNDLYQFALDMQRG